jgi:uncharacterized membrane protein YeaQ/YmgE (transglycosylase-associated protein family)
MLIDIIIWLVIGGVAGWLAGLRVKGYGFGVLGNIVVGIIGAFWQVGFCHWPALFSSAASSQRSSTPSSGR